MALIKIISSIVGPSKMLKGISNKDFDKLEKFTKESINKKTLVGDIIDNADLTQIIYEYGGSSNLVVIKIYWKDMKLNFSWRFDMPIFPYLEYSNDNDIDCELTQSDCVRLRQIVDDIKKEDFVNK